jgi:pSer/pThr/pTyr-binding forkhead associated (FHA) protein
MKDGSTKQLERPRTARRPSEQYLQSFDIRLVAVAGPSAGTEYRVTRERMTLGRGPGVDLAFGDQAMSRQHAVVEVTNRGLSVRDLGSTNGLRHNGKPAQTAALAHGDRLQLGTWTFQILIEPRSESDGGDAYELSADV